MKNSRYTTNHLPFSTRAALCIALLFLCLIGGREVLYAQEPGITSPATGGSVSGDVPIFGTANIDTFQRYEMHYKKEPSGDDAYIYFGGGTAVVLNGQLGVLSAGGLPSGTYSLRLRVVKADANYAQYYAQNLSVNQGPAPTPTPEESEPEEEEEVVSGEPTPTPIPTATFTPAPQPTPIVGAVVQPDIGQPPTPTPLAVVEAGTTDATGATEGGIGGDSGQNPENTLNTINLPVGGTSDAQVDGEGGSLTRELGEALSLSRLRANFFDGMQLSAVLFFGIFVLLGGKRLLSWAWTQFS